MHENVNSLKAELSSLRAAQENAKSTPTVEAEQQLAKLRNDLSQAQQDADSLRASASVNSSLANTSTEVGSKPVAEQVAEHVQAVRMELEARHNERIKETEETLEKRTNTMKAQLSKKLTEGKTQIRQSLVAEHEQNIKKLKSEHDQTMEKLAARHRDEMEELRLNESTRFAKLQENWEKERQTFKNSNESADVKAEGETSRSPWQPSEAEARTFLQSNEVARSIIKKNIITQVNKAKDELTTQLKEEHQKAMAESQNKANTTKEHAVMMEGKKTALQVNMANNKWRAAQYKVDLVGKAAQETPEKPIKEVWPTIKDAKPQLNAAPQLQQGPPKTQQTPGTANSEQLTPSAQNAANTQQKPPSAVFGQPSQFNPNNTASPQQQPPQLNLQPSVATFGRPSPAAVPIQAQSPSEQGSSIRLQPVQSQVAPSAPNADDHRPPAQVSHPPQQKPSQNAANHHPNAGTGPGALRGLQQSSLPIARGGSMRGNPNARGRGSSVGRGAPQGINTNQSQQPGRNSPTNPGMNPGAKQFVPGNKRPRDEEQNSGDASIGKRIRGGGGSA